jgi:tetratricopeptide (TPR) repeat protein
MPGESNLSKGDVLTLGKTELRFIPEEQPRWRRLPAMPKRRLVLMVPSVVVFLCAGLAIRAALAQAKSEDQREKMLQLQSEVAALFQAGKGLVREGKWEEALANFEQAHQRAAELPGLETYLARAKIEVPNQRLLATAASALEANQLGAAAEALRKVSRDTQLHQRLSILQSQLAEKQAPRIARAQEALESREYEQVLSLTEDLLQAFPGHQEAATLRDEAQEGIAELERSAPVTRAPNPWDGAVARFRDGDLEGARARAAACAAKAERCRKLARDLKEFETLYRNPEELDLPVLEKLIALDSRISLGKPGRMAGPAMVRAAGLYYKRAVMAKGQGRWRQSSELAKKTLHLSPTHPGAVALVGELSAKAKELFLLAYAVKDTLPDEALHKLKEVIEMTPPTEETHLKAVGWLEKLSR